MLGLMNIFRIYKKLRIGRSRQFGTSWGCRIRVWLRKKATWLLVDRFGKVTREVVVLI